MIMKIAACLSAFVCLFAACDRSSEAVKDAITQDVICFAEPYFNYQFNNAVAFCTPESRKWLVFAASNVTEADLDVLRQQAEGAEVEVSSIEITTDTTAMAGVDVSNFLLADSIGRPARIEAEGRFILPVVLRGGRWLVRMEGLPQSERQGRD